MFSNFGTENTLIILILNIWKMAKNKIKINETITIIFILITDEKKV